MHEPATVDRTAQLDQRQLLGAHHAATVSHETQLTVQRQRRRIGRARGNREDHASAPLQRVLHQGPGHTLALRRRVNNEHADAELAALIVRSDAEHAQQRVAAPGTEMEVRAALQLLNRRLQRCEVLHLQERGLLRVGQLHDGVDLPGDRVLAVVQWLHAQRQILSPGAGGRVRPRTRASQSTPCSVSCDETQLTQLMQLMQLMQLTQPLL